jgi:hypothetical protein
MRMVQQMYRAGTHDSIVNKRNPTLTTIKKKHQTYSVYSDSYRLVKYRL